MYVPQLQDHIFHIQIESVYFFEMFQVFLQGKVLYKYRAQKVKEYKFLN